MGNGRVRFPRKWRLVSLLGLISSFDCQKFVSFISRISSTTALMNTKQTGDQSTAIALAMLLEAGYSISVPWGDNQRYDLIAELEGKFWRIQCKTGWVENGCVRFNTSNKSTSEGKVVRRHYEGQVECFMVWCPENRTMYCIPIFEAPKTDMKLRLDTVTRGMSHINWASDFIFRGLPALAQG